MAEDEERREAVEPDDGEPKRYRLGARRLESSTEDASILLALREEPDDD